MPVIPAILFHFPALIERSDDMKGRDWRQALAAFVAETDRALDLFSGFMPEVRALDDVETLTILHGTISARRHAVGAPETPLTGGQEPRLGEAHLRTLTILGPEPFAFDAAIVGRTGADKSVLLALLALQFRRYADAQVYVFETHLQVDEKSGDP